MKYDIKKKRNPSGKLALFAMIWGIIFTSLMMLLVGGKIIISIIEEGAKYFIELQTELTEWENPTLVFITYIIGYTIIWRKPLWGSIIIIVASIFYVMMAGFDGPPIFAAPGFLVGILYFANWFVSRKTEMNPIK